MALQQLHDLIVPIIQPVLLDLSEMIRKQTLILDRLNEPFNTIVDNVSAFEDLRILVGNWPLTINDEEHPEGQLDVKVANWPLTISDEEHPEGDLDVKVVEVFPTVRVDVENEVSVVGEVGVHGDVGVRNELGHEFHVHVRGDVKVRNPFTEDEIPIPIPLIIAGAVVTTDIFGNTAHVIVDNEVQVHVDNTVNTHAVIMSMPPVDIESFPADSIANVFVVNDADHRVPVLVDNDPFEPVPVYVTNTVVPVEVEGGHITVDNVVNGNIAVSGVVSAELVQQALRDDGTWVSNPVNVAQPLPVVIAGPDNGIHNDPGHIVASQYIAVDPETGDRRMYLGQNGRLADVYRQGETVGRSVLAADFSA